MYIARELIHGDERLSLVLDELGYTTGAGYQIWANQAAFREDLQIHIAENIDYATLEVLGAELADLDSKDLGWSDHLLAVGDLLYGAVGGREAFYLTLRFYAMSDGRPEQISAALGDAYDRLSAELESLFASMLDRFDRKVGDGAEIHDLVVAATSLLEGYALRARIRPADAGSRVKYDGGDHGAFSVAFLGVMDAFTEPR
jgi:hypothetical protein